MIEFLRMRADRAEGNSVTSHKPPFSKPSNSKPIKKSTNNKGIATATPVAKPPVGARGGGGGGGGGSLWRCFSSWN